MARTSLSLRSCLQRRSSKPTRSTGTDLFRPARLEDASDDQNVESKRVQIGMILTIYVVDTRILVSALWDERGVHFWRCARVLPKGGRPPSGDPSAMLVHGWHLGQRPSARRSWWGLPGRALREPRRRGLWSISERRMGPRFVVMPPPAFDDDPRLLERIEDLTIQQLIAKLRVEALAIAVLPWAAQRDVAVLAPTAVNPVLHRLRNEFRADVRTHMAGNAQQCALSNR